ncbi:MAG TPA: OadG family transporter subunit [Prolixibacteraceae bacterium]|nr:OadG family transporter subunit [Prolixibacteraceae bacterium]
MWIINAISFDTSAIDEQVWTIFLTGIIVVFLALWAIALILKQFQNAMSYQERKAAKLLAKQNQTGQQPVPDTTPVVSTEDDTRIAIAMAMHLCFNEHHDDESFVLGINVHERVASPWAHKKFDVFKN